MSFKRSFNFYTIKFAEKDHDVVVFDGARSDCLRLCLLENSWHLKNYNEEFIKFYLRRIYRKRFLQTLQPFFLNSINTQYLIVVLNQV